MAKGEGFKPGAHAVFGVGEALHTAHGAGVRATPNEVDQGCVHDADDEKVRMVEGHHHIADKGLKHEVEARRKQYGHLALDGVNLKKAVVEVFSVTAFQSLRICIASSQGDLLRRTGEKTPFEALEHKVLQSNEAPRGEQDHKEHAGQNQYRLERPKIGNGVDEELHRDGNAKGEGAQHDAEEDGHVEEGGFAADYEAKGAQQGGRLPCHDHSFGGRRFWGLPMGWGAK